MLFWFFYMGRGIRNKNLSKVVLVESVPFVAFVLFMYVFVLNGGRILRN